jgi:hypothetical protein
MPEETGPEVSQTGDTKVIYTRFLHEKLVHILLKSGKTACGKLPRSLNSVSVFPALDEPKNLCWMCRRVEEGKEP